MTTTTGHYQWCDPNTCVEGTDTVADTHYWIHTSPPAAVTVPAGMRGQTTNLEVRVQQQTPGAALRDEPGEDGLPYIAVPGLPLLSPAHARALAAHLAAAADTAEKAQALGMAVTR